MFVGLRKPALENQLDDLMVQLSAAVGGDVWWGGYSKLLHICIGEVIRDLGGYGDEPGDGEGTAC